MCFFGLFCTFRLLRDAHAVFFRSFDKLYPRLIVSSARSDRPRRRQTRTQQVGGEHTAQTPHTAGKCLDSAGSSAALKSMWRFENANRPELLLLQDVDFSAVGSWSICKNTSPGSLANQNEGAHKNGNKFCVLVNSDNIIESNHLQLLRQRGQGRPA